MKILSAIALSFCFAAAYGQAKEFYNAQNSKIDSALSLYYAVGYQKTASSGDWRYNIFVDSVKTYYTSTGSLRSREFYSEKGSREGRYIQYHLDGSKKEIGTYKEHHKSGPATQWYENGSKHFDVYFLDSLDQLSYESTFEIVNYWSPTGEQLVKDRNGYCSCILFTTTLETGKVKNGVRDSVWNGYDGTSLQYTEKYDNGFLLAGESYSDGSIFKYKSLLEQPEFKGGYEAMTKFIMKHMTYPKKARRDGHSGTVYVSFIVGKTGTVEETKILRGVWPELDEEALRVVKLMNGKWIPGKLRGKEVYVRFNLPLKFKLF